MNKNSNKIQQYIVDHKCLPLNYRSMLEKEYRPPETVADGRKNTYLYF